MRCMYCLYSIRDPLKECPKCGCRHILHLSKKPGPCKPGCEHVWILVEYAQKSEGHYYLYKCLLCKKDKEYRT